MEGRPRYAESLFLSWRKMGFVYFWYLKRLPYAFSPGGVPTRMILSKVDLHSINPLSGKTERVRGVSQGQ